MKHFTVYSLEGALLLLLVSFFSLNAACWENFPEFESLTDQETVRFDGPSLLSSEYSSDLLAYGKPSGWEYFWLTHNKALEISFGSLNTTRFALENRLKIQQPLTQLFEIRFWHYNESNQERQSTHSILELIFWITSKLGLVFYGEPSFRKPQDDTGIAFLFRPSRRHEIRIFNTFVDVTRLKYPDSPDTFVEPNLPYSRGIVGRVWSQPLEDTAGNFMEYAWRYETPTTWQFFEQNYIYHYWKWFASLYGRYQISKKSSTALRIQFDRKYESKDPTGPTPPTMDTWFTNRFIVLNELTLSTLGPQNDWDLTFGIEYALRQWNTNQGLGKYKELLPYCQFGIPAWGPPNRKDHWIIGYVLTWHRENGPPQIGIWPENDGLIEQRLNLSYEFSFGGNGKLVLLASADLDKLGTRASWGGGCGQLQLSF